MKKKVGLFLLLAMATIGAGAQQFDGKLPGSGTVSDDFGLWTGVGISQNLGVRGLSADFDLGLRTNNDVRNIDRWSMGLGIGYTICPYLKVGASYTYMYGYAGSENKPHYKDLKDDEGNIIGRGDWNGYNRTNAYWRSKNRFAFDLKTGIDVGRFSFSLRERYQLTGYNSVTTTKDKYRYNVVLDAEGNIYDIIPKGDPEREPDFKGHKSKEYLRSKLEASYNIRHCSVTPSASVELENNLRDGFRLDEVRYSAGVDWKVSKKVHVGADYHFNKGHDDDNDGDLHAIEVSLKLKNVFFPAKK